MSRRRSTRQPKRQLLTEVWGPEAVRQTGNLRVYMKQLRHKLEEEPACPRYLLTETGVGLPAGRRVIDGSVHLTSGS
jgi:two-component system KDP operon response regulator KdpE